MNREDGLVKVRKLQKKLEELIRIRDFRRAAEVTYVLSQIYLDLGQEENAVASAKESLELFDKCAMETEKDCATLFGELEGVLIPSLIHQEVVLRKMRTRIPGF